MDLLHTKGLAQVEQLLQPSLPKQIVVALGLGVSITCPVCDVLAASHILQYLVYRLIVAVSNHIHHPLYKFPGPPIAAWSNALHSFYFLSGRQPYKILALHMKYGPIVRTAPNELSFTSVGSWKDIYGFRQGHLPFIKSEFYDGGSFADQAHSIVSERDPTVHARMRKYLSHAFSDRSLKEQEDLVAEVVDLFIQQIGMHGNCDEGTDMVMWFNLTTFDIIGSLAFGETFGGLESGISALKICFLLFAGPLLIRMQANFTFGLVLSPLLFARALWPTSSIAFRCSEKCSSR